MTISPNASNLLAKHKGAATAAFLLVLLVAVLPFFFSSDVPTSSPIQVVTAAPNEANVANVQSSIQPPTEIVTPINQTSPVQTEVSLTVQHNPFILGNTVIFTLAVSPQPPTSNDRFSNLTISIIHPDGTVETLGPFQSDPNGQQSVNYTPDLIGSYSIQLAYDGQFFASRNVTYLGALSPVTTLSILSDEIPRTGKTWIVDDDGPADFHTIQAAINAAADGDIIKVLYGVYHEHVVVNKTLAVQSMQNAVIDASGDPGSVVKPTIARWNGITIIADSCTVSGFTMRNGANSGIEIKANGCIIQNNICESSPGRGGISLYGDPEGYTDIPRFVPKYNLIVSNKVRKCLTGLFADDAHYNNVTQNVFEANEYAGIYLLCGSSNNVFTNNNISGTTRTWSGEGGYGVILGTGSENNLFAGNTISNNTQNGIQLYGSSNNIISGNFATSNGKNAIELTSGISNIISANILTNHANGIGISLAGTAFNTIYNNTVTNNSDGIRLGSLDGTPNGISSHGNTVSRNIIRSNSFIGISSWFSENNLISNNTVNSNTLYGIYICASPNNTITDNDITANGNEAGRGGIDIYGSSNNIISGNYVANNFDGINVDYGSINTAVVGNNVSYNAIGIYVFNIANSHGNNFYHNNLVGNAMQVSIDNSPNISWDNGYPSGGNFWSNYHGVDASGDGIGDTAYVIDVHNRDRYPLMFSFSPNTVANILGPRTWTVDDDSPADFHTIQEAINAASNGDTILVRSGTYQENPVVNKSVSLVGENVYQATINAKTPGKVVAVAVSGVTIAGFRIQRTGASQLQSSNIGVYFVNSNTAFNNVSHNIISGHGYGISVSGSQHTIDSNYFENNGLGGIYLNGSSNNVITSNAVTGGKTGIFIAWPSSHNVLRNNNLTGNELNLHVISYDLQGFMNDIDTSNTVNGKPVYYWMSKTNMVVPRDAGAVALVNCTNITVQDLQITSTGQGVLLAYTNRSIVQNNNVTNCDNAVRVQFSSYNTVNGNYIYACTSGVALVNASNNIVRNNTISACLNNGLFVFLSTGNQFYFNSLNNRIQVTIDNLAAWNNSWDNGYPSGGNFWSNYNGADANHDGIGDAPYVIDANNVDRYPLMTPTRSIPILIVTPQNGDYYRSNNVPLTFVVNEEFSMFWYGLDSRGNFTLAGNTTLTGLSLGAHKIIVYGHTLHGETKASEAVTFTVMTNTADET